MRGAETLDRAVTHVLGGTGRDGMRCHRAAQNGAPFKAYELFVCESFHFMVDRGR